MGGLGKGVTRCTSIATVQVVDEEGLVLPYTARVVDPDEVTGEESALPPIYGLVQMAERNTFIDTRAGVLHEVPEGKEGTVIWPKGTKQRQCTMNRSGHWVLPIREQVPIPEDWPDLS